MRSLTLSLILVVVAAVIGLGWLISEIYYRVDNDDLTLNSELAGYQRMGSALALTLDNSKDSAAFLERWRIRNDLSITVQERENFPIPTALTRNFESGEPLILESDGDVSLHFYMKNSGHVMSLVLPVAIDLDNRSTSNLVLTLLFYIGVVAIVLVWLYPLIRRLVLLRNTARSFGQGDLSARVGTSRISYIADIEREFNRMADRIQTLLGDNKLLSQAVSHDLKTPLARLRFGIDTLEETEDKVSREKYARRINKDLHEMESLVETLLQYARLDESSIKLHREKVDLKFFATQLFKDLPDAGIRIQYCYTDADTTIEADKNYLAIQLNNIMSNALRHANSEVKVTITASSNTVAINIEDNGEGIPFDERGQVIKPFWRGRNSTASKGHGMGLAIVARIAEWLGAKLVVADSRELGGAAISLQFQTGNLQALNVSELLQ